MTRGCVTIGETMTVFTPNEEGPLRHARSFSMKFGGAKSNVAIGLSRLSHSSRWISRLGEDEFGDAMQSFIRGEGDDVPYVSRDPHFRWTHLVLATLKMLKGRLLTFL
ncbi:PfkB family carbohydrate kinase [Peribacillus frigoritolerans]|uniref:PfkB family carbohydrate kinase n=1 Tax=Peribacillus castrilensis TaxID=2897690 RepID=UPI002DCCA5D7|nr:PfkB family carbohydrate kinase [Peribacillus castrilensis]